MAQKRLHFEIARPSDARGIVRVIRHGFDTAVLGMIIYGCEGVVRYVADQISFKRFGCDTVYIVAKDTDRVVGAAEIRRQAQALFLAYISVEPNYRSRKLASELLRVCVRCCRETGQERMVLDVLESNKFAGEWYRRLGFHQASTSLWFVGKKLEGRSRRAWFSLSGWGQAQLAQKRYGFSQFQLRTQKSEYTIGYLGTSWFRLTEPAALLDPGVAAAHAAIGKGRDILAILHEEDGRCADEGGLKKIRRTMRLTIPLDQFMCALSSRIDGADA